MNAKNTHAPGKSPAEAHEESQKLAKSSLRATGGVVVSRASGVVRTLVVNSYFGVTTSLDAFNAAFRFPNSLRDLFADGALSAAFIKVFVDARAKGIEEERRLISIVCGFFIVLTGLISILCAVFSLPFMTLISSEKFRLSEGLTLSADVFKLLAFYLPLTMLNAVAIGVLGVLGHTFRAMNSSLFLSVGMIGGSLILAPIFSYFHMNGIFGLAIGSLLGVAFQLIYQLKPLRQWNLLVMPNFNVKEWISYAPLKEVLVLMGPRALGQGALTLALLINTMFAIQAGTGALTYIVTAMLIIQVPIGLFGVATGFAAQPALTKAIFERKVSTFSRLLVDSLHTVMWLSLLTTAAFNLFILPFYQVLFEHGKVSYHDTMETAFTVCAYSMGILFSAGSKVLVNAYYALGNTRQIVFNACVYLALSAALSAYLAPRYGTIGLGISYGVCTALDFLLNFIFLKLVLRKKMPGHSPYEAGQKSFYGRVALFALCACVLPFLGLLLIKQFWIPFPIYFHTFVTFPISLGILVVGGGIFVVLSAILLRYFGPENLRKMIRRR